MLEDRKDQGEKLSEDFRARICLPMAAVSNDDIEQRYGFLRKALEEGLKIGLVDVVREPGDLSGENQSKAVINLGSYLKSIQSLVFMHSGKSEDDKNTPFNSLENPEQLLESLTETVNFASQFPSLKPQVSFHLGAYYLPGESPQGNLSDIVDGLLVPIIRVANDAGVLLSIENVPVLVYSDWKRDASTKVPGKEGKYWSDLITPYPLGLTWRPEHKVIRNLGFKYTIDICHLWQTLDAIRVAGYMFSHDRADVLSLYGIKRSDFEPALDAIKNYSDYVLDMIQKGSVSALHFNQTTGIPLMPSLFGDGERVYGDSASLVNSGGRIPRESLRRILLGCRDKDVDVILEINETDFKNSPNTKASLEWVLDTIKSSR